MTKQHFIDAAAIVRNILAGKWTFDPPSWADQRYTVFMDTDTNDDYTRAVQTAEAFIMLFSQHNPRFDTQRFLIACGLASEPTKARTR